MKHAKPTFQSDPAELARDRRRRPLPDIDDIRDALRRFAAATPTCAYCAICGYVPNDVHTEPNRGPLRFWSPDDGWTIASLCAGCADEALPRKPHPDDYAYGTTNGVADDIDTDKDPLIALDL